MKINYSGYDELQLFLPCNRRGGAVLTKRKLIVDHFYKNKSLVDSPRDGDDTVEIKKGDLLA